MPRQDFRKVTFNMFEADAKAMEAYYGYGWTERMREIISAHVKTLKPKPKTLADFIQEEPDA